MSITGIIMAAVIVGGTGLFIGIFLGLADKKLTVKVDEKEEAILHYIFERGSISTGKAAEVCGYKSRTSARKVIDEMAEKGYIVKNGKGASVRYSICDEKVVKK